MTPWTWIGLSLALSQTTASVGYISGRVVATEGGEPVAYANLIVVGTTFGAMTDTTGCFFLKAPPGQYRLRALMMGYRNAETDVIVATGDTTHANLSLDPRGLTRAQAEAESIGVDVHVSAEELPCEIVMMKDRFIVGDYPAFAISIRNESETPIVLAEALDGSDRSARYPRIVWSIEGPDGPLQKEGRVRIDGGSSFLDATDFFFVKPGTEFHPYEKLEVGYRAGIGDGSWAYHGYGVFDRPGRYTVTVTYRTDEPDIRRWTSWEQSSLPPGVSEAVRRVPRVALTASMVVHVEAE